MSDKELRRIAELVQSGTLGVMPYACLRLARLVLADLDRRAAEEAERALPHSPEWLKSIGGLPDDEPNHNEIYFRLYHLEPADRGSFVAGEHVHVGFCPDGSAWVECYDDGGNSKEVIMIGYYKTRGQVLDLLLALGVKPCQS